MTPLLVGLALGAVLGLLAGAVIVEGIQDRRRGLWWQFLVAECSKRDNLDAARWRAMRSRLIGVDWSWGEPATQVAVFSLDTGIVGAGPEGADAIADVAVQVDVEQRQKEAAGG